MIRCLPVLARLRCAKAIMRAGASIAEAIAPELRETPQVTLLVPPVPLAVRLGLSGILLAISTGARIAAEWVTPELKDEPPANGR